LNTLAITIMEKILFQKLFFCKVARLAKNSTNIRSENHFSPALRQTVPLTPPHSDGGGLAAGCRASVFFCW
jgi:hypothetical protein